MIFETSFGERPLMQSSADTIAMLDGPTRVAAFAMSCAERLGAVAEELAESATVGASVRRALDMGWRAVPMLETPGNDFPDIREAVVDLDAVVEAADGNLGRFHGHVDDAISAAAYALEVFCGGQETACANAAERVREVYFQVAKEVWPALSVDDLARSPVVQAEVDRQDRDAREIAEGPVDGDLLLRVQRRADGEGRVLVRTILGRDSIVTDSNPVAWESPALF